MILKVFVVLLNKNIYIYIYEDRNLNFLEISIITISINFYNKYLLNLRG